MLHGFKSHALFLLIAKTVACCFADTSSLSLRLITLRKNQVITKTKNRRIKKWVQ
nr:MAG TPA: hypothetical protein [Caudoviricetes sp.]